MVVMLVEWIKCSDTSRRVKLLPKSKIKEIFFLMAIVPQQTLLKSVFKILLRKVFQTFDDGLNFEGSVEQLRMHYNLQAAMLLVLNSPNIMVGK